MVTALNVGNSILKRAFKEKVDITPMKLQKMIYFVYRDYLQMAKKPLFDERFETWKYGPVVPSVYDKFKKNGSNAIREYAYEDDNKTILAVDEESSQIFKRAIDSVWESCKEYDGMYLSLLTHQVGTAWRKAWDSNNAYLQDCDILEEYMNYG